VAAEEPLLEGLELALGRRGVRVNHP
jgi:hypothetical protein